MLHRGSYLMSLAYQQKNYQLTNLPLLDVYFTRHPLMENGASMSVRFYIKMLVVNWVFTKMTLHFFTLCPNEFITSNSFRLLADLSEPLGLYTGNGIFSLNHYLLMKVNH